jgi:hypothetical protein
MGAQNVAVQRKSRAEKKVSASMAGGLDKFVAPGRHTLRPGRAGLRRVSLAALIMLVVQYGLGIFLNLYVAVPASDAHAGIFGEIATAPLALTVHALLGLALIGTAILLVVRAVAVQNRLLAVLAPALATAPAPALVRAAYPAVSPAAPASGFPAQEGWPIARPASSPASWFTRE